GDPTSPRKRGEVNQTPTSATQTTPARPRGVRDRGRLAASQNAGDRRPSQSAGTGQNVIKFTRLLLNREARAIRPFPVAQRGGTDSQRRPGTSPGTERQRN